MEILLIYLVIAYFMLFLDAVITIANKHKYIFWQSLIGALLFPIVMPLVILTASGITKNFPPAKEIFKND